MSREEAVKDFYERSERGEFDESHLRARVYENPFAVVALSKAFGLGPWDQRFGPDGERLRRLYVGERLAQLEADETTVGITHDSWLD